MLAVPPVEIYPEQFGALGDGTTDDAPAFQAAINSLIATGGVIKLHSRRYFWQTPVVNNTVQALRIEGAQWGLGPYDNGAGGPMGSQIICQNANANLTADNVAYFSFRNITMYQTTGPTEFSAGLTIARCFKADVQNVRINNFATGITMRHSTNCTIDNFYLASLGATVSAVAGLDLDGGNNQQNASIIITRGVCAHASYSGAAYGYKLHGNRLNDITIDNCEAAGGTTGFLIDGSAGIEPGYAGDIRFTNCIADNLTTYGFHVTEFNTDGLLTIANGWAAGAETNVYIANGSLGVNVHGMQVFGGENGVYFQNGSSGDASGNIIREVNSNGLVIDNCSGVSLRGNHGYQKSARRANLINILNSSTYNTIANNIAHGGTAAWAKGVVCSVGSNYNSIVGNVMRTAVVTNPYVLNLDRNHGIVESANL